VGTAGECFARFVVCVVARVKRHVDTATLLCLSWLFVIIENKKTAARVRLLFKRQGSFWRERWRSGSHSRARPPRHHECCCGVPPHPGTSSNPPCTGAVRASQLGEVPGRLPGPRVGHTRCALRRRVREPLVGPDHHLTRCHHHLQARTRTPRLQPHHRPDPVARKATTGRTRSTHQAVGIAQLKKRGVADVCEEYFARFRSGPRSWDVAAAWVVVLSGWARQADHDCVVWLGLTLVHFPAQPEPSSSLKPPNRPKVSH